VIKGEPSLVENFEKDIEDIVFCLRVALHRFEDSHAQLKDVDPDELLLVNFVGVIINLTVDQ